MKKSIPLATLMGVAGVLALLSSSAGLARTIVVTDSVAPINDLLIPFGNVTVGQSSTQSVSVMNSGLTDLIIGNIGSPAPPFSIFFDNCSNQTLAPFSNCTLDVGFAPITPNAFVDTFEIPSDDPQSPYVVVGLQGFGGDVVPIPAAVWFFGSALGLMGVIRRKISD